MMDPALPTAGKQAWSGWIPVFVLVAYLVLLIPWVKTNANTNDGARLAEIEAIVERGTLAIDGSRYSGTSDKIFVHGHFYSNKPPMLSVIGALAYAPEHRFLHWSFQKRPELIVYSVAFATAGAAGALLIVTFYHSLGLWRMAEWQRLALTGTLGLATLILPYSIVLNNHVVSAALSFGAFWLLFSARLCGLATRGRILAAGFLAALGASIDVVTGGVFLGLLAIYAIAWPSLRARWIAFAAGTLLPIAGLFALNVAITGGLSLPYNNPTYYRYPGSDLFDHGWITGAAQVISFSPTVLLHRLGLILLSRNGFFSFMPVLYVPLVAMGGTLLRRRQFWPEALFVWTAALILVAIHAFITEGISGYNFGFRYLVPLIPFVLFFAPAAIAAGSSPWSTFFVISAIYSMGLAFVGTAGDPWSDVDIANHRVLVYFALNYLLLAAFVGLCGVLTVRALAARGRPGAARAAHLRPAP